MTLRRKQLLERHIGVYISDKHNANFLVAPEIIELHGASTKSDIWCGIQVNNTYMVYRSLGCTIIELLSGKPPYYDLDQMQALFKIVQDDCPPLPEGISPLCKDFLMQCFQKEPLLRQSADALLKHRWITTNTRKKAVFQYVTNNTDNVRMSMLSSTIN